MTTPSLATTAAVVADFHAVVLLLVQADTPAATRVAETIMRWLAGEEFASAANLASGWRQGLQQAARDTALAALVALRPELDDQALSRRIAAGVSRAARMGGTRPDDRERACYFDLAHAGVHLSERTWRRLIAEARGQTDHSLATAAMSVWSAPQPEK